MMKRNQRGRARREGPPPPKEAKKETRRVQLALSAVMNAMVVLVGTGTLYSPCRVRRQRPPTCPKHLSSDRRHPRCGCQAHCLAIAHPHRPSHQGSRATEQAGRDEARLQGERRRRRSAEAGGVRRQTHRREHFPRFGCCAGKFTAALREHSQTAVQITRGAAGLRLLSGAALGAREVTMAGRCTWAAAP
jgi:hypothetical protein